MADHVPYADIPQTMRDVLDGFYSAGAVERWWNAPILCATPGESTSAAELWQTVEGRKFVQEAVEERAQAVARLDRDMEGAWNQAVAHVTESTATDLLVTVARVLHVNDGFEPEFWDDEETERDLYLDRARRLLSRVTEPICPWCPPGCSSCVESRDCECYTHQDSPDRNVPATGEARWR